MERLRHQLNNLAQRLKANELTTLTLSYPLDEDTMCVFADALEHSTTLRSLTLLNQNITLPLLKVLKTHSSLTTLKLYQCQCPPPYCVLAMLAYNTTLRYAVIVEEERYYLNTFMDLVAMNHTLISLVLQSPLICYGSEISKILEKNDTLLYLQFPTLLPQRVLSKLTTNEQKANRVGWRRAHHPTFTIEGQVAVWSVLLAGQRCGFPSDVCELIFSFWVFTDFIDTYLPALDEVY